VTDDELDELDALFDEVARRDATEPGWWTAETDGPPLRPSQGASSSGASTAEPPVSRRPWSARPLPFVAILGALLGAGVVWLAMKPVPPELIPRGEPRTDAPVTLAAFADRDGQLIDLGAQPGTTLRSSDELSVRVRSDDPELGWALVWVEDDAGHTVALAPRDDATAIGVPNDGAWAGPTRTFVVGELGLNGSARVVAVFVPLEAKRSQLEVFAPEVTAYRAITVRIGATEQ